MRETARRSAGADRARHDGIEALRCGAPGCWATRIPAADAVGRSGADRCRASFETDAALAAGDQALEVCSRVDVREAEDFRASSLETLRHMVVAGLGITLMPELAVESPYGAQRGLTVRQFGKPTPTRTVGAVWRKSSTRAAAIAGVCDVVAGVLAGKA